MRKKHHNKIALRQVGFLLGVVALFVASVVSFGLPRAQAITCGTGSNITFTVSGSQCIAVITTTGAGTFTTPSDWTSTNKIEVIGGGGSGGVTSGTNSGGSGGGGGAYAALTNTASLLASHNYGYSVGTGGAGSGATAGNVGADTWLCNNTSNCATSAGTAVIVAAGGGGRGNGTSAGSAGVVIKGTGNIGGAGDTGTNSNRSNGAGGGGAGGASAAGGDASGSSGGAGNGGLSGGGSGGGGSGTNIVSSPATGSGGGGNGATSNGSSGGSGGNYGGAGAGGRGGNSGSGKQGVIAITYTPGGGGSTPTVSAISPTSGSTAGGTSVVITGTNFTGVTAVAFGGVSATSYTVNSATQITATSPAGSGSAYVRVTTSSGTSAIGSGSLFTYVAVPSIASVSPAIGPTYSGTSVVITGSNFTGATAVKFGTTNASSYTVNSDSQITAIAPAKSAGTFDITVTNSNGTSATGASDQFTYTSAPYISSMSPTSGSTSGGTSVIITGFNFTSAYFVQFGGNSSPSYTVNSDTQVTAVSPAGSAGTVDVQVCQFSQCSPTVPSDQFAYVLIPSVGSVLPVSGPPSGGTIVTITGSNFTGATAVKFGATNAASYTVNSSSQITATAPAGSGSVDITVTANGITSSTGAGDQFTYGTPPSISNVYPAVGPTSGGTLITITGSNFTGATAVKFGATNAASYTVNSDNQISATSPAGSAGTVDITVTAGGLTSATGAGDTFAYGIFAPTVTTSAATNPTTNSATLNGNITATGGANATQYGFAYGTDSTLNTLSAPTSTLGSFSGTGSFTQAISSLFPNTTYYFRAYAINSGGTGLGNTQHFTTSVPNISFSGSGNGVSGLPAHASAAFSPTSCTPTNPTNTTCSVLTITAGSNTPPGTYPITVTGTDNGVIQSAIFTLVVTAQNPCSDIINNPYVPDPPPGCLTPSPSPGQCIPSGDVYNGFGCVAPSGSITPGSFYPNPPRVRKNNATTLYWQTSGMTYCTIDHGVGTVPSADGINSAPTPVITTSTVFTLSCGDGAATSTANASVGILPVYQEI